MPYQTTATTDLIAIIRARSVRRETNVKLTSGRTSDIYINLKPTLLHAKGNQLIGSILYSLLSDNPPDYVAGMELGGAHVATALCSASGFTARPIHALAIRKQAKEHGTRQRIEGLADGESLEGKNVAVVEDTTTTGNSAMDAVRILGFHGANVTRVLTVVDREEGAASMFASAGLPFNAAVTLNQLR